MSEFTSAVCAPASVTNDGRGHQIDRFLATSGWQGARLQRLAGDASFRQYYRTERSGATAILMDAPPEREDVGPFVRIAGHLLKLGLSAPFVLAADELNGLLLLEDFGDNTFTRLLAADCNETDLYCLAVDTLIYLHRLPQVAVLPPHLPAYDRKRLLDEALLLADWYLPAVFRRPLDAELRETYIDAWDKVIVPVLTDPPTLVLRDFHVDNLMRLPDRAGIAACGLLDFQDAVAGPAAYDLVSLLEDARRDISDELHSAMLARYRSGVRLLNDEAFMRSFAILGAQRHAKVIGIFTRLSRRDGKPIYLPHIPRVWRLLERALRNPALAPVARWIEAHVPRDAQRVPLHLTSHR